MKAILASTALLATALASPHHTLAENKIDFTRYRPKSLSLAQSKSKQENTEPTEIVPDPNFDEVLLICDWLEVIQTPLEYS